MNRQINTNVMQIKGSNLFFFNSNKISAYCTLFEVSSNLVKVYLTFREAGVEPNLTDTVLTEWIGNLSDYLKDYDELAPKLENASEIEMTIWTCPETSG